MAGLAAAVQAGCIQESRDHGQAQLQTHTHTHTHTHTNSPDWGHGQEGRGGRRTKGKRQILTFAV